MASEVNFSNAEINKELERILSDEHFIKSPLLSRFLRFVVEKSLLGQSNQIKEYSVGVAVLQKPNDFNPQLDASVRIAAIRLRKLLEEFYKENGNAAGIRIQLPKGSYCPVYFKIQANQEVISPMSNGTTDALPPDSICVLPFSALIHDKSIEFSSEGFSAYLSEKLSLFQDIQVKAYRSVSTYFNEGGELVSLGASLKVTYYISGTIEINGGNIVVSVNLFDTASNTIIWSQDFTGIGEKDTLTEIIDRIVTLIVASLAGYSGVIHYKKFSADHSRAPSLTDSQANAVFWFYHFQTKLSESIFHEALYKLEKATQENPDCDLCWAVLAHLYAHSIVYRYNAGVENPLARAQAYLARALAINPNSQQGHITMAWVNIFLRNKEIAINALEKADEINPNSSYAKAVCSLGMSFLGAYDRSSVFMEKAIPLHPLPYWWFNLPSVFMSLLSNDYEKALFYARKIGTPAGIHEKVFEMISLFYLGEMDALRKVRASYIEKYPTGIEHAASAWPQILFDETLVDKITFALNEISNEKYFQ